MNVRDADPAELDALTVLWHEAWRDAHAEIVPPRLTVLRTRDNFRERLERLLPATRVVGPPGSPTGFCTVKEDELYQLFVAAPARGSGAAAVLLADAEARLAGSGVTTAWLACAIGNNRAARFYEKCGWHMVRTMVNELDTPDGIFRLEVWRYEKALSPPPA
jgi:GNAT superfamily N-acetyltransferase